MKQPITIVFEGVDRSGKDELIEQVSYQLSKEDITNQKFRNPAHPVRELLLSKDSNLNSVESLLIFYAGYLNVHRKIETSDTSVALINRRMLSSYVYQKIGLEDSELNHENIDGLFTYQKMPVADLSIILDVNNEELENRTQLTKLDENDRYESSINDLLNRADLYGNLKNEIETGQFPLKLSNEYLFLDNNNYDQQEQNVKSIVNKIKKMINA